MLSSLRERIDYDPCLFVVTQARDASNDGGSDGAESILIVLCPLTLPASIPKLLLPHLCIPLAIATVEVVPL